MLNKNGFTLIELTLVLFIIATLSLLVPVFFRQRSNLNFEVERVKDFLIYQQAIAIFEKRKINLDIRGDSIFVDGERELFSTEMDCGTYRLSFNERGNINMANTLTCTNGRDKKEIIFHLGNGNIYVK